MKNMIERFALYLLRKVGRNQTELEIGNEVLFFGRFWTVVEWKMMYDGKSAVLNLTLSRETALRETDENA